MRDFSNWTLVHLVREQAARFGERRFMRFDTGLELSFAGLDRRSDAVAAGLAGAGVAPGDRVLMLVKNRAEFMAAMVGIMKAGAIFVPINTDLKGAFLQHQLRNCDPKVALVDTDLVDHFDNVDAGDAAPELVLVVAGDVPEAMPDALSKGRCEDFASFEAAGERQTAPDITPTLHDICAIMYTSGTTGPSKGVLLPHGHFYYFAVGQVEALRQTADDIYYLCMPLFHVNGLNLQAVGSLMAGSEVFCIQRFSPNRWLDDVIDCGATLTNALGVMPEFIFNTPKSDRDQDHRLRVVMAVPLAREWAAEFERRFNTRLLQGFGMTEVGMTCWGSLDEHDLIPGCAGYVMEEFYETCIANPETDVPVPEGEVGELLIRPRFPGVFSAGYYKMPEKTVESWRNMWFHTGDACRMDEKGRMVYVDRIKDCIRRRGENISAYEVEQVINTHPELAESAVVGVKVAGAGGEEEVMAVIVERPGVSVDPVALLDFCVPRMPRYAVPRYVLKIGELDKTASGKLRKGDIRDAGLTDAVWDREAAGYVVAR